MADVIDTLAGIGPGSLLDAVRAERTQARIHAQASHDSLFKPLSESSPGVRTCLRRKYKVIKPIGGQDLSHPCAAVVEKM